MNFPQYPMMNPVQQAVAQGVQSWFNRGTRGPVEYGQVPQHGGYNAGYQGNGQQGGMQNSWTPPHVAPQHYQQQPYAGMGFNPNQSTGQHQYGMPQQEDPKHEHVRQYMRDICSGKEQMPQELMQMMCMAATEAVREYMGNGGGGYGMPYSANDYSEDSHKEFKETIEKIRRTQNPHEKTRMVSECFPEVQPGTTEHKVLMDLVTKVPSVEQRAAALQIKPEQYLQIKKQLKQMHK